MTDHITLPHHDTPAIDYESVKEFFFTKLSADLYGRGRMESALYHTAQWIFLRGCHEREHLLQRIASLEADNVSLRHAMNAPTCFDAGDMADAQAKAYRRGAESGNA